MQQAAGRKKRVESLEFRAKNNRQQTTDHRLLTTGPRTRDRKAIRVLAKRLDNIRYVIAVNNTPREVQAAFTLSEPAGTIVVVGEGRGITPSAMRLAHGGQEYSDVFAPYATHVYKIERK